MTKIMPDMISTSSRFRVEFSLAKIMTKIMTKIMPDMISTSSLLTTIVVPNSTYLEHIPILEECILEVK